MKYSRTRCQLGHRRGSRSYDFVRCLFADLLDYALRSCVAVLGKGCGNDFLNAILADLSDEPARLSPALQLTHGVQETEPAGPVEESTRFAARSEDRPERAIAVNCEPARLRSPLPCAGIGGYMVVHCTFFLDFAGPADA